MVRPTNAVIWVFLYANLLWALGLRDRLALKMLQAIAAFASVLIQYIMGNQHSPQSTFCERTSHPFHFSTARTLGIVILPKAYPFCALLAFLSRCMAFGEP